MIMKYNIEELTDRSFRPLSGIIYFNSFINMNTVSQLYGFRPLSGIIYFNRLYKLLKENKLLFPSPLGDYLF